MSNNYIVSTDLDGTLLDHHDYSFAAANQGLQRCTELEVPVVINTSKTYAEVIALQNAIGLDTPIIVENGSALIAAKHLCLKATDTNFGSLKIECQSRVDGAQRADHMRDTIFPCVRFSRGCLGLMSEYCSTIVCTCATYTRDFQLSSIATARPTFDSRGFKTSPRSLAP